jgi:lipopolysaccharide/colanic/teichoic acid biosynthesis glycosyltransferase
MANSMTQTVVARSRPTRPALRIYDARLSSVLDSLPDPYSQGFRTPDLSEWLAGRADLSEVGGNQSAGYQVLKRTLDLCGAFCLLTLLAPMMVVVWAALMITTRGKPIFRQTRVGLAGRRFEIYKFRTMRLDAEARQATVVNEQLGPVFKNRRDPRITRLGYWLRRLSLDETLQLFNVLKGEMSLVGPRPPIPKEVVRYEPWQFQRLAVKPGLTCLWQVSGRCEIDFNDWMLLDWWYVRNQSLRVDLTLLARTPLSVLSCRGAY